MKERAPLKSDVEDENEDEEEEEEYYCEASTCSNRERLSSGSDVML